MVLDWIWYHLVLATSRPSPRTRGSVVPRRPMSAVAVFMWWDLRSRMDYGMLELGIRELGYLGLERGLDSGPIVCE
jgi:hypothetical protein